MTWPLPGPKLAPIKISTDVVTASDKRSEDSSLLGSGATWKCSATSEREKEKRGGGRREKRRREKRGGTK